MSFAINDVPILRWVGSHHTQIEVQSPRRNRSPPGRVFRRVLAGEGKDKPSALAVKAAVVWGPEAGGRRGIAGGSADRNRAPGRPIGEGEDSYFGDFIEDESIDSPVSSATQGMLRERIDTVLKTLSYREREIIKLRYGIGDGYTYTLEEVGRIFKVTRERVRQVEAKAIRKMQHPVRARRLEGFLDHKTT